MTLSYQGDKRFVIIFQLIPIRFSQHFLFSMCFRVRLELNLAFADVTRVNALIGFLSS